MNALTPLRGASTTSMAWFDCLPLPTPLAVS
jgi:hypothetical protein